jgi:hypothetical protein
MVLHASIDFSHTPFDRNAQKKILIHTDSRLLKNTLHSKQLSRIMLHVCGWHLDCVTPTVAAWTALDVLNSNVSFFRVRLFRDVVHLNCVIMLTQSSSTLSAFHSSTSVMVSLNDVPWRVCLLSDSLMLFSDDIDDHPLYGSRT